MANTPQKYSSPYKKGYGSKSLQETGVSFFRHFPRNMLRPYRIVYEFRKDLEAFSYLKHPNFAMSEMADSIVANLNILADLDCRVLRNGKVVRLMENEKDVLTSMIRVNRTNDFPASIQHLTIPAR